MSGRREPALGKGASITEKNSLAATMAWLADINGVLTRSKDISSRRTDMSTTMTTPALLMAPTL